MGGHTKLQSGTVTGKYQTVFQIFGLLVGVKTGKEELN